MALFGDASVLAFESRRAKEMAELIRINHGQPVIAPALVEVPLESNDEAFAFGQNLQARNFDIVIFLTGVGTRLLGNVLETREQPGMLADALRRVTVVARGPKPTAVLKEWKVPIAVQVPEPNTWRELLQALEGTPGQRVAVQEYGRSNPELLQGLAAQGREVVRVPVYQWRLPDDTEPLEQALEQLLRGEVAVALFTTGVQIDHFLEFAERRKQRPAAVTALRNIFVGSIGPTCSEALEEAGVQPALEPSHPKMGLLVREAALAFDKRTSQLQQTSPAKVLTDQ